MPIEKDNQLEQYEQYTKDFVDYWDDLIGWKGRLEGEGGFYQRVLKANGVQTVADVACGTGFHSVTLSREGLQVTSADGSENMVRKTRENAKRWNAELQRTEVVDWLRLHEVFDENSFDAVICLGNSFTHLFGHEERRSALLNFHRMVKPGGMVIVDHRNYDGMLAHGYSSKHKYYYTGKGVDARPITLTRALARFEYTFPDRAVFHLNMYPLKHGYVTHLLEDAGLINVEDYGDFERPYDVNDVDFIQQVAYKPRED